MKKHIFIPIIAMSLLMAACSDENTGPTVKTDNAISFTALVPKPPRSQPTTTASINNFVVYAFTGGKPYMQGVKVTRKGAAWIYNPPVYWPTTPVNFYAFSPDITNSPSIGSSGLGTIPDFTNPGNIDLLYAVNMNETAKSTPVMINFRHAMSKVDVLLSSANENLIVKVSYVSLNNVAIKGTFNFPNATTSPELTENIGNWTNMSNFTKTMLFAVIDYTDIVQLTSTPTDFSDNTLSIDYIIPQNLTELSFDGNNFQGTSIEVDCEIYDAKSGVKIWPNSSTPAAQLVDQSGCGRLMFPVTTSAVKAWKPGHNYVYNIKIDNPSVLNPIDFNVTVDDFIVD